MGNGATDSFGLAASPWQQEGCKRQGWGAAAAGQYSTCDFHTSPHPLTNPSPPAAEQTTTPPATLWPRSWRGGWGGSAAGACAGP